MTNRERLIEKLKQERNQIKNNIKHKKLYNIRNFVIRSLIKSGIIIDYALPFIIASTIVAYANSSQGKTPFKTDEVRQYASIETIDTSNGIHNEKYSFDYKYKRESVEHTTGWKKNNNGLYERTVTTYRLDDSFDLSDTDKIFHMKKEGVETIQKSTLSPDDYLYNEEALIITSHHTSEEDFITKPETSLESATQTLLFLLLSAGWGNIGRIIKRTIMKTYVTDKLKEYHSRYRILTDNDIEELKKILEIKNKNLSLLTNCEEVNDDAYTYKLRKDM